MLSHQSTLFSEKNAQASVEWRNKFIEAGVSAELIDFVMQTKAVRDYENLYHNLTHLVPDLQKHIDETWQLLCLSGEGYAFQYAVQKLRMSNKTASKWGMNPLHFLALSGVPARLDDGIKLGIDWKLEAKGGLTILHYAAMSRSHLQLQKVLELEKHTRCKLERVISKLRHVLHFASFTGNDQMIQLAIKIMADPLTDKFVNDEERKKNLLGYYKVDQYGFNALDYLKGGKNCNASAIQTLALMGITSRNETKDFHFGGIENIPSTNSIRP